MLKSRIRSQQIENRLGWSGNSPDGSDEPRPEEASAEGTTLFAISVVGVLLVGVAVGFAASRRGTEFRQAMLERVWGPPPYRSRVADVCDKGWKDDRYNRDQIHCHLTRDMVRLCDPRERHALVDRLLDYQAAMERSDRRSAVIAMRMIRDPSAAMAMGMAEARSRDETLTEAERTAQRDKTMELSREIMSPLQEIERDNINTATKATLVADVTYLVERGFLAAGDFTSPPPKIVKEGIAAAGFMSKACS